MDEVILTLKIRCKKENAGEARDSMQEFVDDFMDETISVQEGEIEEAPAE